MSVLDLFLEVKYPWILIVVLILEQITLVSFVFNTYYTQTHSLLEPYSNPSSLLQLIAQRLPP